VLRWVCLGVQGELLRFPGLVKEGGFTSVQVGLIEAAEAGFLERILVGSC